MKTELAFNMESQGIAEIWTKELRWSEPRVRRIILLEMLSVIIVASKLMKGHWLLHPADLGSGAGEISFSWMVQPISYKFSDYGLLS